jgi:ABC-type sulfate/molybdate transport systems ATPase subunit
MADRVAVLSAGRIEQVDTPERLYMQPATPFVHQFLGESVRLACTVQAGYALIAALPEAPIPTECPPGPAFALIRPHEIVLRPEPGPARIIGVHATGPMMRVQLRLGDQDIDALQPLAAWKPTPGDTCLPDLSRAHIYPVKQ